MNIFYNYKARKNWIYLIISTFFINGYLPFLKFEMPIMAITLFRAVLILATLYCLTQLHPSSWGKNLEIDRTPILASVFVCIMFGMCVWYSRNNLFLPGGHDEMIALLQVVMLSFCIPVLIGRDEQMFLDAICAYKRVGIVIALLAYFETIFGWTTESCRYSRMVYFEGYSYHPPTTVFGNENNLAAFLLVVSAIIIIDIMSSQNFGGVVVGAAELAVVLVPVAIIDSTIFRIGIVIMVVVSIAVIFIISRQTARNIGRSAIIIAVPLVLCFLLKKEIRKLFIYLNVRLSGGYITFGPAMDKLINGDSLSAQLQNSGMGTVTIRKNLFFNAIDAAMSHPIFGYGPNGFQNVFKAHPEYTAQTGGIVDPHNFIAETMVNYGVPMAVFLVGICIAIILIPIRASKNHAEGAFRPLIIACFALSIAFAFSTVMPSSFISGIIYFVPLFILVSGCSILCKEKAEHRKKRRRYGRY